jgi:hypothetical protein
VFKLHPRPSQPTRPELADPAGVQTRAEATHGETDVWVAKVPADVARLFRAYLYSIAHVRRLELSARA